MTTLKQLVLRQNMTGETDGDLISEWFKENDMAVEGIDIISKLAKKEITDVKYKMNLVCSNLNMYAGNKVLIQKFGINDGSHFDRIIRLFIMQYDLDKDYPSEVDWLREFVPTKDMPKIFWQPFLEFLHKHKIYFKDEGITNE